MNIVCKLCGIKAEQVILDNLLRSLGIKVHTSTTKCLGKKRHKFVDVDRNEKDRSEERL